MIKQLMKSTYLILLLAFSLFIACRNGGTSESPSPSNINLPLTSVDSVRVLEDGAYCFRYMMDRDTYDIHLILDKGKVTGEILYKDFGKKSIGDVFSGFIKEDMIRVKSQKSKGIDKPLGEMFFKLRGRLLIFGEVDKTDQSDTLQPILPDTVRYEGLVFSLISCDLSIVR